jgi:hypothetical protein
MKTALQEAIEDIKEYRDSGNADVDTCNAILMRLASMLGKEKEVMCEFADDYQRNCFQKSAEQYYNETFDQ